MSGFRVGRWVSHAEQRAGCAFHSTFKLCSGLGQSRFGLCFIRCLWKFNRRPSAQTNLSITGIDPQNADIEILTNFDEGLWILDLLVRQFGNVQ